jgi:hypothetical protein
VHELIRHIAHKLDGTIELTSITHQEMIDGALRDNQGLVADPCSGNLQESHSIQALPERFVLAAQQAGTHKYTLHGALGKAIETVINGSRVYLHVAAILVYFPASTTYGTAGHFQVFEHGIRENTIYDAFHGTKTYRRTSGVPNLQGAVGAGIVLHTTNTPTLIQEGPAHTLRTIDHARIKPGGVGGRDPLSMHRTMPTPEHEAGRSSQRIREKDKEKDRGVPLLLRPYGLFSLFDGTSTTYTTVTNYVGKHPSFFVAAEYDENIRPIAADKHGMSLVTEAWQYNKHNVPTRYIGNAWLVFKNYAAAVREAKKLFPDLQHFVIIAGSPCQDLTLMSVYEGVLGIVGERSVLSCHTHAPYCHQDLLARLQNFSLH